MDAYLRRDLYEAHVGGLGSSQTKQHLGGLLHCRHYIAFICTLFLRMHISFTYKTYVLYITHIMPSCSLSRTILLCGLV